MEATLQYLAEDLGYADMFGNTIDDTVTDSYEVNAVYPLTAKRYVQMRGVGLDTSRCRREHLLGFLG